MTPLEMRQEGIRRSCRNLALHRGGPVVTLELTDSVTPVAGQPWS